MAQNSNNQPGSKANYIITGTSISAMLALIFSMTGNPGLIGFDAIIGFPLAKAIHKQVRMNRSKNE